MKEEIILENKKDKNKKDKNKKDNSQLEKR